MNIVKFLSFHNERAYLIRIVHNTLRSTQQVGLLRKQRARVRVLAPTCKKEAHVRYELTNFTINGYIGTKVFPQKYTTIF